MSLMRCALGFCTCEQCEPGWQAVQHSFSSAAESIPRNALPCLFQEFLQGNGHLLRCLKKLPRHQDYIIVAEPESHQQRQRFSTAAVSKPCVAFGCMWWLHIALSTYIVLDAARNWTWHGKPEDMPRVAAVSGRMFSGGTARRRLACFRSDAIMAFISTIASRLPRHSRGPAWKTGFSYGVFESSRSQRSGRKAAASEPQIVRDRPMA